MDTIDHLPHPRMNGRDAIFSNTNADKGSEFRIDVQNKAEFSLERISLLRHNFSQHPLLQLDQLESLAQRLLPRGQCRFIAPGATQESEFVHHPESPDGRSLSEVFKNITLPGSWVALYNAETDPQYAELVNQALSSVETLITQDQPGIFSPQAFIFISAPPSVTPFHIDRENNFWLQIRGRKIINVWDCSDRDIISAPTVENFIIDKSLDGVKLNEEIFLKAFEWDLGETEGVYFPSTSPHATRTTEEWVSPGNEISISIGFVFYTDKTRKDAYIHSFNRLLRKMHIQPKFPGNSKFDGLKFLAGKLVVALKERYRNYHSPTGF